jgi:hypothetical protein
MRILRIELRRSAAVWAALVLLGTALGLLYVLPGPWWHGSAAWDKQWVASALWMRYLLAFVWPIAVGAGALQALRDSRSGMTELLTTTPRPGWARAVKLTVAFALSLTLTYLLLFGLGAVQVIVHKGFFDLAWLPNVLVGILGLVAGACLGLGVGRALPHPVTPPLLTGVALVASAFLQAGLYRGYAPGTMLPNRLGLLLPGLDEPWHVLLVTATRVDLGQGVWFAGLAGTGLLLLIAGSVRARLLALLPMGVGLAVALALFPATRDGNYMVDQRAARLVCDGEICVAAMHENELPRLAGPAREALRLLTILPNAPKRVEEITTPTQYFAMPPRATGVVYVDFAEETLLRASPEDLVRSMVAGVGMPTCSGEYSAGPREDVMRIVTAAWFTGEVKRLPEIMWLGTSFDHDIDAAWTGLRALPAEQQKARIEAVRQANLGCQKDLLDVLTGVAR